MKKYIVLLGKNKYEFDTLKTACAYAQEADIDTIYRTIISDAGKVKYIPLEAKRQANANI